MTALSYQLKSVPKSVFRAYDIRGIIGEQLAEDDFYSVGVAVACRLHALNRNTIFLARDGRLTSETLANALAQGLMDSGIHVLDLGEVATPLMYYATSVHDEVDSGLMVTGSHNPADYNGIKMVIAGTTLAQDDINLLYELNQACQKVDGQGGRKPFAIVDDYKARIVQDIHLKRPLKVVVDCGNGVAGPVIPEVLKSLGCDVIPLFCDVDGRFPNHHPDPTVEENLIDLKAAVKAHQADIGLAFDGDADRLGVITCQGELIWPDRLMIMYAEALLARKPESSIVFDVKCSSLLSEAIKKAGGKGIMCPTGHSIVKGVMKREKAELAGEMSGHLFFKDRWYGFDDALYSACRLLEILSASDQSVSQQFAAIPNSINTPEIKIPILDDEKFTFMQRFQNEAQFPDGQTITIDGVRVEFPHGWGLIRASNTTPCLVARFEAQDVESLKAMQALFKSALKKVKFDLQVPF